MKQCKLCGTPLGKEPSTEELETHWKKHHSWHWESNKEKTPEDAIFKKTKLKRLGRVVVYSMPRPLIEGVNYTSASRYKRKLQSLSNICLK